MQILICRFLRLQEELDRPFDRYERVAVEVLQVALNEVVLLCESIQSLLLELMTINRIKQKPLRFTKTRTVTTQ